MVKNLDSATVQPPLHTGSTPVADDGTPADSCAPHRSHVNETVEAITEGNIESILCLEDARRQRKPAWYRIVEKIARFCGTIQFLWINVAWFAAWILVNTVLPPFDPYPFTFLILVVSLEAIVLSILILISQNLSAIENERRHHLDLQINLLNEREMTALLRLVTRMADKLSVSASDQEEVSALSHDTDPTAVLHQIVKAEHAHRTDPSRKHS